MHDRAITTTPRTDTLPALLDTQHDKAIYTHAPHACKGCVVGPFALLEDPRHDWPSASHARVHTTYRHAAALPCGPRARHTTLHAGKQPAAMPQQGKARLVARACCGRRQHTQGRLKAQGGPPPRHPAKTGRLTPADRAGHQGRRAGGRATACAAGQAGGPLAQPGPPGMHAGTRQTTATPSPAGNLVGGPSGTAWRGRPPAAHGMAGWGKGAAWEARRPPSQAGSLRGTHPRTPGPRQRPLVQRRARNGPPPSPQNTHAVGGCKVCTRQTCTCPHVDTAYTTCSYRMLCSSGRANAHARPPLPTEHSSMPCPATAAAGCSNKSVWVARQTPPLAFPQNNSPPRERALRLCVRPHHPRKEAPAANVGAARFLLLLCTALHAPRPSTCRPADRGQRRFPRAGRPAPPPPHPGCTPAVGAGGVACPSSVLTTRRRPLAPRRPCGAAAWMRAGPCPPPAW